MGDAGISADAGCSGPVRIEAPFPGDLYLDGRFTGLRAPAEVPRWSGLRRVGVGSPSGGYFRAEVDAADACRIQLRPEDRSAARSWRARYITLHAAFARLPDTSTCTAALDDVDADRSFQDFERSVHLHFEPDSFHTMAWEIDRQEVRTPFEVRDQGGGFYAVDPADVAALIADVVPGTLDTIVVFFRSAGPGCVIPGDYLGLSVPPSQASHEAGFTSVKLEVEGSLDPVWTYLEANDPGVWIHEFLHTVADQYYPGLGATMPEPSADGSIVHAAEAYHYAAPWMTWYSDLIAGRVVLPDGYGGITPELLLRCTLKDRVNLPGCR
ncbi:MAG: hypothetical protein U1E65_20140 [Myxococcota bacterium]